MENNSESEIYDTSKKWKLFLNRPFGLFKCSLWYKWYVEYATIKLANLKKVDALFVEEEPNLVRHYRVEGEMDEFDNYIANHYKENRKECIERLEEGIKKGKDAKERLEVGITSFNSLEEAVDYLMEVAEFTITFPHVILIEIEKMGKRDEEIEKMVSEIRKESHYPRILKEIVEPMALEILQKLDPSLSEEDLGTITYQELLAGDLTNLEKRKEKIAKGIRFVYQVVNDEEEIKWTNNTKEIISELEGTSAEKIDTIKGQTAYAGKAKGIARIIRTIDGKGTHFEKGDVLVTINSNPNLMPFIIKCVAIVADEGGISSHAAIISRELKKPCIIATKNATKVLKDGDLIEVDANNGIVKILKKAK